MNTSMWEHPATQRNVERLKADGVFFVEPDDGEMACGTIGPGRLSEPERIVAAALEILRTKNGNWPQDLAGEKLLITVGATREALDPVRFLSNNSSGRMGFAIAEAATRRGADVRVIAGSTSTEAPPNVAVIRAFSAAEMHAAVMSELPEATVFIGAAAVADYRPVQSSREKIKKTDTQITIKLERTKDILADVAATNRDDLVVIGFAAETENVLANAREKLDRKKLDAIVANDVTREGVGFDAVTNEVTLISRDEKAPIHVPLMPKTNVANIILDEVVRLRAARQNRVTSASHDRRKKA
jgi:phosphopantothenoylcysteine decarboxylase/phosphopantothenate--cysteine ligase